MPWHISNKHSECSGFAVVKDDDGKVVGCHKTRGEAEAQLAALYASEKDTQKSIWDGTFNPKNIINSFEE